MAEWPVLEDEWVLTVIERGMRLPPDVVVALLIRHRTDATRLARAAVAAGPVTRWVTEHVPELAPRTTARVDADAVMSVPPLAVPPELADLLGADAHTFASTLGPAFDAGRFGASHRAVLVNLFARCRPEVLDEAAAALSAVDPMSPSAGLGAGARRPRANTEPDAGRDRRGGSGERSDVTGSGEARDQVRADDPVRQADRFRSSSASMSGRSKKRAVATADGLPRSGSAPAATNSAAAPDRRNTAAASVV